MLLVELGEGPQEEYLTLIANGWSPSRRAYPHEHVYLRRDAAYQADTAETVTVTETDERMRSVTTTVTVDYAAPVYTTPSIVKGETIVHAADITELQLILADIRYAYGMSEYMFSVARAGETSLNMWTTHIAEIQQCIRQIQAYINGWDTSSPTSAIILPTMLTASGPSADVMNQLRQIVTML